MTRPRDAAAGTRPGEIEARVMAYNLAVALEHLIYRTMNALPNHEEVRERFTDAAWPLFAEAARRAHGRARERTEEGMNRPFEPELGQMLFGNPAGAVECSRLGDACVDAILAELARLFWNKNQRVWDRIEDPCVAGIAFRPYWWGDEDAPERLLPNLCVDGTDVEIRWYKHPGRSNSLSKPMTPEQWNEWIESAFRFVRAADEANQ